MEDMKSDLNSFEYLLEINLLKGDYPGNYMEDKNDSLVDPN
jgi:hypothetical protein